MDDTNVLAICIKRRPRAGWGYTVRLGDRLLAERPVGAFEDPALAFKQAMSDLSVALEELRSRRENEG